MADVGRFTDIRHTTLDRSFMAESVAGDQPLPGTQLGWRLTHWVRSLGPRPQPHQLPGALRTHSGRGRSPADAQNQFIA
jgi:hypothetical protein